jgi:hypothetical protein
MTTGYDIGARTRHPGDVLVGVTRFPLGAVKMRIPNTPRTWLIALAVATMTSATAWSADTAPKPAAKPGAAAAAAEAGNKPDPKAAMAAVQAAVQSLTKELAAHEKDPKTPLRDKSNYFTENPSPDVTPEVVLQALVSKLRPDPTGDSYIKWQLLSAVSGKFDEKLAPTAADALMKAARPLPRPGISYDDRRKLDPLLRDVKTNDNAAEINKKLDDLVTAWEEKNKLVLTYRDELYAKLPTGPATLLARLQDAAQRGEAGIDSNIMIKGIVDDIAQWSSHDAAPRDCMAMADKVQSILLDRMGGMRNRGTGTGTGTGTGNTTGGGGAYRGKGGGGRYGGGGGAVGGGGGGGIGTGAGYNNAAIPAKFYDRVEYNAEKKVWAWHEGTARFVRAEDISDLINTLEDAAKANKGAGGTPMKK